MPQLRRATVVVVTFNHSDMITDCLDALRATLGPNDEAIVVDNASSDNTADVVADAFPWVRLLRSEVNHGFGAGCNVGAAAAQGRMLVFLNPDTRVCDGWLDALLAALDSTPGAGLATAKLLLARAPHLVDTFGNEVHISGITTSRGWGESADSYNRLQEVSAISGACFAISRQLFQQLGGFDERLFLYYEDTDLSLRARLAGYRCIAVPDARVLHDHRAGFSAAKLRYLERNRWWTLLKIYRWRTIIALVPVLLMGELVAWAMALRSGPQHVLAKALAWGDLVRWMPDLPHVRAAARSRRSIQDSCLLRSHGSRLPFTQVATGTIARTAESVAKLAFRGGRTLAAVLGGR